MLALEDIWKEMPISLAQGKQAAIHRYSWPEHELIISTYLKERTVFFLFQAHLVNKIEQW